MADELEAGNALQGDPTDIVITAEDSAAADQSAEQQAQEEGAEAPVVEKPHGNKGKTPWYMERINEETNKRRAVEQERDQRAREAEEARALLERMQNGDKTPSPPRNDNGRDTEAEIEARAALKLLQRDSTEVRSVGLRTFTDFADSLKVLTSVGATSDDFVQDLIDTDKANAHKMIDFLAKDPDLALELVNMTSKRRVAALTRIAMTEIDKPAPAAEVKKPAAVSKVPAPRPVLEAARSVEEKAEDEMSDQEWSSWRKKQMQKSA